MTWSTTPVVGRTTTLAPSSWPRAAPARSSSVPTTSQQAVEGAGDGEATRDHGPLRPIIPSRAGRGRQVVEEELAPGLEVLVARAAPSEPSTKSPRSLSVSRTLTARPSASAAKTTPRWTRPTGVLSSLRRPRKAGLGRPVGRQLLRPLAPQPSIDVRRPRARRGPRARSSSARGGARSPPARVRCMRKMRPPSRRTRYGMTCFQRASPSASARGRNRPRRGDERRGKVAPRHRAGHARSSACPADAHEVRPHGTTRHEPRDPGAGRPSRPRARSPGRGWMRSSGSS